jgi:uncharacterized Rmd1/YagE family protein
MTNFTFIAHAVEGEIDLNRLATALETGRKLSWEEPLIITPGLLAPQSGGACNEERVYLYYFGAVVFFNCSEDAINGFYRAIGQLTDNIRSPKGDSFGEQYSLRVDENAGVSVSNNGAIVPSMQSVYVDIIAYTLAKSVALEQIEALLDVVFDRMEETIARLDRGALTVPDSQLAKTASSILNFKYRSISHVMILDKPDITWDREEADRLYAALANLFELQQRYSQIRHKADTLLDINAVFTGLSHARRSARLEWIIIILIALEIALFILEMLRH